MWILGLKGLNKPISRDSFLVISSFADLGRTRLDFTQQRFDPGVLLGILGGGVPPGSPNPDPQKMPVFFTPVFRPGLLSSYPFSDLAFKKLCHQQLDQNSNKKYFLKFISNSQMSLSFLFVWNETINTFVHSPSSLANHIRLQTKMNKVNLKTRFETKTAKSRALWGGTYPYDLYRGVPPSPRGRGFAVWQAITKL